MRRASIDALLVCVTLAALPATASQSSPSGADAAAQAGTAEPSAAASAGGSLGSRQRLTGNWGGLRDAAAARGIAIDFGVTYTFQGVAGGGLDGPVFRSFSDEGATGNTVSGELGLELDTGEAGLWQGGFLAAQLEGRAGRSVLQRAGSLSAVNNDALYPNVIDRFDSEALALTELTFTQYLGERVAFFGGLLNTAEGDANELAGSSLSHSHFLNSTLLYSLVEDATAPNVSLGGGLLFEPHERISGSFSVFTSEETAGENPFDRTEGTTFSTEWTAGVALWERPGAHTFGFLYGIDANRADIAADPRIVLAAILAGLPVPATSDDTWAFYYNAYQYLQGDADGGFGVFVRFGVSDGNPNPIRWNAAGGLGGSGLFPGRGQDHWGVGVFYLDPSEEDLLRALGVGDEVGGELFYNVSLTPWLHVTLDAQVIDSALPRSETAWILGLRTHVDF